MPNMGATFGTSMSGANTGLGTMWGGGPNFFVPPAAIANANDPFFNYAGTNWTQNANYPAVLAYMQRTGSLGDTYHTDYMGSQPFAQQVVFPFIASQIQAATGGRPSYRPTGLASQWAGLFSGRGRNSAPQQQIQPLIAPIQFTPTARPTAGQQPNIGTGPIINDELLNQMLNQMRAGGEASTAGQVRDMNSQLSARGFGSQSPLMMALQRQYESQNLGESLANEGAMRRQAMSMNAQQQLAAQQAAEAQFASRQAEDLGWGGLQSREQLGVAGLNLQQQIAQQQALVQQQALKQQLVQSLMGSLGGFGAQ